MHFLALEKQKPVYPYVCPKNLQGSHLDGLPPIDFDADAVARLGHLLGAGALFGARVAHKGVRDRPVVAAAAGGVERPRGDALPAAACKPCIACGPSGARTKKLLGDTDLVQSKFK